MGGAALPPLPPQLHAHDRGVGTIAAACSGAAVATAGGGARAAWLGWASAQPAEPCNVLFCPGCNYMIVPPRDARRFAGAAINREARGRGGQLCPTQ